MILIDMFHVNIFQKEDIIMIHMYRTLSGIALVTVLLFGIAAAIEEKTPSGTISIASTSVGIVGVGINWGEGHIKFKGKEYHFSMSGLSLLDFGISKVSAKGEVYDLKKVSDLSGNYVGLKVGISLGGGVGGVRMQNQNGVILRLDSTQKGIKLNLGPKGVTLKLKEK